jgi:hypothetical protein
MRKKKTFQATRRYLLQLLNDLFLRRVPSASGYRTPGTSPLIFFKGNALKENVLLSLLVRMATQPQVLLGGSKNPVYRLCSAPKTWYDRVREVSSAAVLDCDAGIDALAMTLVLTRASMPAFVIHVSQ